VSDRGQIFEAQYWQVLQKSCQPKTNGQTERINQNLKDMLRACVLEFHGNWEDDLPSVEFLYNNSHQSTIRIAPFKAQYGRKCRTPLC